MATTRVAPPALAASPPIRRWSNVVPALALMGAGCLAVQGWVWLSWLADGPEAVRQYRDHDSTGWYFARFFEGLIVVVAIGMLIYLVRSCRREGRLTFDAMLCLAGAAAYWIDPMASVLALVAVTNTAFFTAGVVEMAVGLYAAPYKKMPAHLVNGLCDAPGFAGTRYGACPGSPGYRIPLR